MTTKPTPTGETALLDRDFDTMTEEEQHALLRAFFGRAEQLQPLMMK